MASRARITTFMLPGMDHALICLVACRIAVQHLPCKGGGVVTVGGWPVASGRSPPSGHHCTPRPSRVPAPRGGGPRPPCPRDRERCRELESRAVVGGIALQQLAEPGGGGVRALLRVEGVSGGRGAECW